MAADVDIAALVNALAWPTMVGVLLVIYRKKIGQLVTKLSPRLRKFSIGTFSIELAEAKRFEPVWTPGRGGDLRHTAIIVGGSYADALLQQLRQTTPADYFVVDLKNGNDGWITSRLYLFTVMLQKVRGVRCIVFVDWYQDIRNHFIGISTPTKVQSALERNYPWLEKEFAQAYSEAEDSWGDRKREILVNSFVSKIQGLEPPNPKELGQWVGLEVPEEVRKEKKLEKSKVWEHASWLDGNKVGEMLDEDLQRPWVNERELQTKSDADKARSILSFEGSSFVAVLDEDRRFKKLIDRQPIVEEAIRGIIE